MFKILKSEKINDRNDYVVSTFYKFTKIKDTKLLVNNLKALMKEREIYGTILIAEEGINSTVSGKQENLQHFYEFIDQNEDLKGISYKESYYKSCPFKKIIVKQKKEIVSLKYDNADGELHFNPGEYVKAEDWSDFISQKDVMVIDNRNDYEFKLGTFEGAINPRNNSFQEFPKWVEENLINKKNRKIALFCTGGVRCEKSTSYLRLLGFENIYHLEGGIINYFIKTKNVSKKWIGECFVFDDRIVINDQCESC